MIDLDVLQKKLDEALEKETPESLRNWLMHKRYQDYLQRARDPVTFDVFKIIREQIEWLEGKLDTTWTGGANTLLNSNTNGGEDQL